MNTLETGQMGIALLRAGNERGVDLSEDQMRAYLRSLSTESPTDVAAALDALFRESDTRSMPLPAVIVDRIHRAAREASMRRAALPDTATPSDRDREFGLAYINHHNAYLAGKITRHEMYVGAGDAARAAGLLSHVAHAIESELGDWRGDHRRINEVGKVTGAGEAMGVPR